MPHSHPPTCLKHKLQVSVAMEADWDLELLLVLPPLALQSVLDGLRSDDKRLLLRACKQLHECLLQHAPHLKFSVGHGQNGDKLHAVACMRSEPLHLSLDLSKAQKSAWAPCCSSQLKSAWFRQLLCD